MSGEVDAYIPQVPEPRRALVERIYARARALAPEATQGMKYAMPCLVLKGKGLVSAMNTKQHIGIYPFSSGVVERVWPDLPEGLRFTKGAIQVPDGVELADAHIDLIIVTRLEELGA